MGKKIGDGHAKAMLRHGLKEVRASMYTGSNIAQPPSYGIYGEPAPGETADARRGDRHRDEERDLDLG
jgi:hypothetical protein